MISVPGPENLMQSSGNPGETDLRNLADSLPQLAWMADGEGTIFWFNRRWYDYTGATPETMAGLGWHSVHHPDHFAAVVAKFGQALAKGDPWEDTFPLRGADGTYRWFLSRANPHRDASGRIVRWYGTNTDITYRRGTEHRLRHSEERFRALVDAAAAVIWSCAPNGELLPGQWRWSAYTGQSESEYVGWGWVEAIHPEDRGRAAEAWTRSVETFSLFAMEYRLRRHDGVYRYTEVRGAPVKAPDGTVREWVGMNVDITERKEAEAKIEQAWQTAENANRAKSQFLANMSHELRTPLSAVIGYSEMLAEELEDVGQAELLPDLRKIEANARHLLSLINDVLDISKIEAGRMSFVAERFVVESLAEDVAAATQSLVERNDNRFRLDLAADLGAMHQDQTKLRQCLLNVVGNAAKFTQGGEITLGVRRETVDGDDWLRFAITDTGIGLTQEQIGRLFERFAQADESTTREFGGTGLGLAITRAFCLRMGGDIAVESVHGEGSTFTIRLPATMPAQAEETEERRDESEIARAITREAPQASEGVVLLVDDDPAARELLQRFLERDGFRVVTAGDGQAGLTLARALKPRAVLLDIEMPLMDGWSVLHAIRADAAIADTPVIITSVLNERGLGQTLGATDYLVKPIDWTALKGTMERYRPHDRPGDILLVDDDEDARERVGRMLQRDGWSVREAENGEVALSRVAEARPALILLDLMMPVMDGFTFLRELRARPDGDVPVVVLTAKDISPAERESLDRQADRVIQKGTMSLAEIGEELRGFYARHEPAPLPQELQTLVDRLAARDVRS